jgi:hypothetical protein
VAPFSSKQGVDGVGTLQLVVTLGERVAKQLLEHEHSDGRWSLGLLLVLRRREQHQPEGVAGWVGVVL